MKQISIFLVLFLIFFSCKKEEVNPTTASTGNSLNLTPSAHPFTLNSANVSFYENVSYGNYARNVFDIFLPDSQAPSSLVIFIHGGGFTGGDKSIPYTDPGFQQLIDALLSQGIAFATINYRFLEDGDIDGVLKPLNDSKRALQFMKYHAETFNLNKDKVVLLGSSGGAGTSLWLAFSDDMSLTNSNDNILQESTRVQGLVCTETQASYDILEWHNTVFQEYQASGLTYDTIVNLVEEENILKFYGVNDVSELTTPAIQDYRAEVDMLSLLTSDDPELYLSNSNNDYVYPTTNTEILHHPLHSKALMDKAAQVNVPTVVYLPSMNIDTSSGESIYDFILRKIGN